MESLLHRYRNITVLFVAILAQIGAIAWQVRNDNDVPLLRIWAVSAVTPVATAIENLRSGVFGVVTDLFSSHGREETQTVRRERDRLRLENQLLKNELAEAQKVGTLAGFQAHSPSRMIGARVIGTTTGMSTHSVLIDRGSYSGVRKGMAVVTPDGIVGKVLEVYKFASQVLSVTDPGFAAAVESQKNHTRGVVKGQGSGNEKVDYIPTGQKVEKGEVFFTSGEDRVFPRGMAVGRVTSVEEGATFQTIYLQAFAAEAAPEEVFVIVDPVHQEIPDAPPSDTPVFLAPDVAGPAGATGAPAATSVGTQADKIVEQYRQIGAAQNHVYGQGPAPNFNLKVPGVNAPGVPASATGATGALPSRVYTSTGASGSSGRAARPASSFSSGAVRAATGYSGGAGRSANGSSNAPARPANDDGSGGETPR
ncbi:MAG TPA: rod shape-determining protein MreC [Bryobacteraceae bacterium]|nr:rod shape-determining protein MreC [Bryobacteraceae bacterium]